MSKGKEYCVEVSADEAWEIAVSEDLRRALQRLRPAGEVTGIPIVTRDDMPPGRIDAYAGGRLVGRIEGAAPTPTALQPAGVRSGGRQR